MRKPYWGPKKLLAQLMADEPGRCWPSPSTVSDLFRRAGLSQPRKRRRLPVERPFDAILGPNDGWSIDCKGWFCTKDGQRCDPLTVSDADSHYLLDLAIVDPVSACADKRVDRLVREFAAFDQ